MAKTYNLNLSPRYVPNWTAWEVAREIACNALDADPDRMNFVFRGPDQLIISTETVPDLGQLFIIGEGTKSADDASIGQFGEGLKMAALAATRIGPPGKLANALTLQTPTELITFEFKPVKSLGSESLALHAKVFKGDFGPGFQATIRLAGIRQAFQGKVLKNQPVGPFEKVGPKARLFVKGVFITEIEAETLWDWNLNDVSLNRDREMVNAWEVSYKIAKHLSKNITEEQATWLLQSPGALEAKSLEYYSYESHLKETLKTSFEALHGPKAILAVGSEADQVAARAGHKVVVIPNAELRNVLSNIVETTSKVVSQRYDFKSVDVTKYQRQIDRLRSLDAIIAAPSLKLCIFEVRDDNLKGTAEFEDQIIWLSEALFTAGNDQELVRTYCHEMAHFMSSAGDATTTFENALDGIAGRLAMQVLGGQI